MFAKLFPRNESTADRIIRIVAGIAIVSQAFVGLQTPWAYLGIVPIMTGSLGSCPMYTLFGIGTCSIDKKANS